jgi:hypothetical protein
MAYGNLDLDFGYCQGYNWIITTLLFYNKGDEEKAFFCLVVIMTEFDMRGFFEEGTPKTKKLTAQMPEFIKKHIPRVIQRLIDQDEEFLIDCIGKVLVEKCLTSIFTQQVPIEISKRILDMFFYEGTGELTMLRILGNILSFTEDRAL